MIPWFADQYDAITVIVRADAVEDGDTLVVTQLPNAVDGLRVRVAAAP